MSDIDENWPKKGDIVRYTDGCTGLAQCLEPHAGGWHGLHCMGGFVFFSDTPSYGFYPIKPTIEDYEIWNKNEKCRQDTIV